MKDPRHTDIVTLHEAPLTQRNFPHWDMGYSIVPPNQLAEYGLQDVLSVHSVLDSNVDINDMSARAVKLLNAFVVSHTPDIGG